MTQPLSRPRLSDSAAYLRLVGAEDEPTPTPVEPPRRRPPWAWIGIGLAVLVVAALYYVAAVGNTETGRADAATEQLGFTASRAEGLAAQIGRACRDGAVPIPYQGACAAAQDIQASDLRSVPQDGANGTNGTDGANGLSIPGRDGTNGTNGTDGEDGADGQAAEPLPGRDGTNGVNGTNGTDGADGTNGTNGRDGVGIQSSVQDPTDNCYRLVTYDNGRTERWGPFCEPSAPPAPPSTTAPEPTVDNPPDTGTGG